MKNNGFLPINKEEMTEKGWFYADFIVVTGDSYVDHPSFGVSIISRIIENLGFKVVVLPQPMSKKDFEEIGKPRYATLISGGNIDSMVANYTVSLKRRNDDEYTAGGKNNRRPDYACSVYSNWAREAFGDDAIIVLGGLEASLRRFAHYDYWSDSVKPSILVDAKADALMFGMSEKSVKDICLGLKSGKNIIDIAKKTRGVAYLCEELDLGDFKRKDCPSLKDVTSDKKQYARAALIQEDNQDFVQGKAVIQRHQGTFLVQNPPSVPLNTAEMDAVYELPFMRTYHPSYENLGGVKSILEVKHSIIHNRGCYGGCNFCALSFHQGRFVSSRSHDSVIKEAEIIANGEDFKGYIHDVGGPSANFRRPACKKQQKEGLCLDKRCLAPKTCEAVDADHSDFLELLRKLREIKGVKKVFVRSGIRYDVLLKDKKSPFFDELVKHHISGQLKVAPEHLSDNVLYYMGKPSFKIYKDFREKYNKLNEKYGMKQFLVPYLMSSHPGATIKDAIILAEHLNEMGYMPEQVQDFYPTPGTISTAMYYTELDPRTLKSVYVAKTKDEKAMQRALLQWRRPDKRDIVLKALRIAKRTDLIGFEKKCLIKPEKNTNSKPFDNKKSPPKKNFKDRGAKKGRR